jgi:hypothetical protein
VTVPTVACTNCGKNFTTDDLRRTSCKYCGTLLAHHARAQEQVAVLNQMMVDRNGNGIPDAYEGIVANAQANALNQALGMNPYGAPNQIAHMGPMGAPMNPLGAPVMYGQVHMANAQVAQTIHKTFSTITIIVLISVVLFTLLISGIIAAVFLMAPT